MFVWMTGLVDASRMWYTENQRKYFFEKVDSLYTEYCVRFVKEILPASKSQQIEQKIRDGLDIEDWWDNELFSGYDPKEFQSEKVYPAMFDDLEKNKYYYEEICTDAPEENIEDWYNCSVVKSLLHEFVNDEEDPFKLNDHLSDKEIACFSYTICSIYVQFLKQYLEIDEEYSDKLLKLFYCGEFAQNEWLNLVNGEHFKEMRPRLTHRFLYRYLSGDYDMGMDPKLFSEFLHDEVLSPIYRTIYYSRYEILKAGRKYLEQNADKRWSPNEMDNFYHFIIDNVKMNFKAPNFRSYTSSPEDADINTEHFYRFEDTLNELKDIFDEFGDIDDEIGDIDEWWNNFDQDE